MGKMITSSARPIRRRRETAIKQQQQQQQQPQQSDNSEECATTIRTSQHSKELSNLPIVGSGKPERGTNTTSTSVCQNRLLVVCATLFFYWAVLNVLVWVLITQGFGVQGYKNATASATVSDAPSTHETLEYTMHWHQSLVAQGEPLLGHNRSMAPAADGSRKDCVLIVEEVLQSRITRTSPRRIQRILTQMGIDEIPAVQDRFQDLARWPQPTDDFLNGMFGCIDASSTLPQFVCSIVAPIKLKTAVVELEEALHVAIIFESLLQLLSDDIAALYDMVDVLMSTNTNELNALRLEALATSLAQNQPSPYLQSNLQTDILKEVKQDIDAGYHENARVGVALASEVHFNPTVQDHKLQWPLGRHWANAYLTWQIADRLREGKTDPFLLLFTNLATCSSIQADQAAASFVMAQILSQSLAALLDNPRNLSTTEADAKQLAETFRATNLESVRLSNPPSRVVADMIARLCQELRESDGITHAQQYAVTDTIPTADTNTAQFAVYMGLFLWFTVLFAGLGLELLTWMSLLHQGTWLEDHQPLWKLAQFVFPLLMATSVGLATHQNYLALPFAVAGLWKLGFPETLVYMHTAIYGTYLQDLGMHTGRMQQAVEFLNAIGTVIHHGAASLLICMFASGAIEPTSEVLGPTIIPIMQHWFVLFRYINPTVYMMLELILEVYFEWTLFSEFETFTSMHWIVLQVALTMLVAHWLYMLAAILEMFIPKDSVTVSPPASEQYKVPNKAQLGMSSVLGSFSIPKKCDCEDTNTVAASTLNSRRWKALRQNSSSKTRELSTDSEQDAEEGVLSQAEESTQRVSNTVELNPKEMQMKAPKVATEVAAFFGLDKSPPEESDDEMNDEDASDTDFVVNGGQPCDAV